MTIRITHPRPELGRQHFIGVDFRDGIAEVEDLHPERELALRQHGFTVEREPVESVGTKLEDLTRKQLEDEAGKLGIDVSGAKNKGDVIALIEASEKVPVITTIYSEPRFEIKIDGERHYIEKGSRVTAAKLLDLEGLSDEDHEVHRVTGPGESELVESIVIDGEMDFVSVSIAATD